MLFGYRLMQYLSSNNDGTFTADTSAPKDTLRAMVEYNGFFTQARRDELGGRQLITNITDVLEALKNGHDH